MLILTRKPHETIVLRTTAGEVITMRYLNARKGTIRIGIEAPESIHILRGELEHTAPRSPTLLTLPKPLKGTS